MRRSAMLVLVALLAAPVDECWAWGSRGHEWLSGVAIDKLPGSVPAFVRTAQASAAIAAMSREPDLMKESGLTHDAERNPGHYVRIADDGGVLGVVALSELPETREQYDTLLRAKGSDQYKAGYLPYSIVIGWQQVRKDFAYWRALTKAIETAATPQERARFEADLRLREQLTLHDIAIFSHYVGDASQPLHVSMHETGWGDHPNPRGYTQEDICPYFAGTFVRDNLRRAAVAAQVGPYTPCNCSIWQHTRALLAASLRHVERVYVLEKEGAFASGDPRGIIFTAQRLAAGATAFRDMLVDAWVDSAHVGVGDPMVPMSDILSGKVRVTLQLFE
jgi:hypothetical protein